MTATKILWGQILLVLATALAGIWGATQFTAWRLAYQPELGEAWFWIGSLPVYLPSAFFWWWYHFDAYAPRIFAEGAAIASGAGFACVGVAIAGSVWRAREAEVRDVQNIADVLVDPEGSVEKRNHWEKTSHALLVGAILHVLYAEADKTLAGVAAFLSDPARPIQSTLRMMMKTPHLGPKGVHPVVAQTARELLNKSENERSGVLSTAMSFLGLYRDPVVSSSDGEEAGDA